MMAGRITRKYVARGATLLLVSALATAPTASNAERSDPRSATSAEGAEEIRLDVPTSISFDPLAESSGDEAPVVEPGPDEAPWTGLPDLPTPVFDNRIGLDYTLGGSDGTDVSDEMWWFRRDRVWAEEAGLPRPRQAPAIGTDAYGEMVMAGGWDENGEPTATAHYYDDGSTEWVYWLEEMPAARAAAGYASFVNDADLYVIGGCTTAQCEPVSDSVFLLDDWYGDWSVVADYPVPVAFPSCGAWKERIYCTGGNTGTEGISDSYVYDRRADTWSPLPDPPTDSWGAQHAMVDGILIVNGGVQGGAVTNNTFGYDVRRGAWIDLPNSNTAKYRGAGDCYDDRGSEGRQFISVGGLSGADTPLAQVEILDGFKACGNGGGVPKVTRYAGGDRYGTAAAIAALYQEPVDTVFVTTGENFPDALAGAARAGSLEAPILLARPNILPEETRAELVRLSPQSVVVVGGPSGVSDEVLQVMKDASGADTVRRLAGTNRYETAAAVAAETETADTVFIATGVDFPDALAGAARAGSVDAPLLLVKRDHLPTPTLVQLDRLSPETIVVLGGKSSVSTSVVTRLREYGAVERIAGANRWETAALVADEYPEAEVIGVASGRTWADALTGAARAAGVDAPIMLVDTDRIPAPSWSELHRLGPDLIELYGGSGAVSDGVFDDLKALYE